ncbi:MAG: hemolysin III family protein [Zavarzinella sp.]
MFRDPVSASTHLFALPILVVAGLFLLRFSRTPQSRFLNTIYIISAIILYTASGTYHAYVGSTACMDFLQKVDLSAIFIFITGTTTPIIGYLLPRFRRQFLITIWSICFIGIASVWLFPKPPYGLIVGQYALLGVGSLVMAVVMGMRANWHQMKWLVGGGSIYLLGAFCDAMKWPKLYPGVFSTHELMHCTDLLGTIFHYVFILQMTTEMKQITPAHKAAHTEEYEPEVLVPQQC